MSQAFSLAQSFARYLTLDAVFEGKIKGGPSSTFEAKVPREAESDLAGELAGEGESESVATEAPPREL